MPETPSISFQDGELQLHSSELIVNVKGVRVTIRRTEIGVTVQLSAQQDETGKVLDSACVTMDQLK